VLTPNEIQVVEVDQIYRDRIMHLQMRTYMYGFKLPVLPGLDVAELGGEGLVDMTLSPHSAVVGFDDLRIIRIGEGIVMRNSCSCY
jgi:polyribonucleotide 5'-hydroxyl-kinase